MYHATIILINEPPFKNSVEAQQQRVKAKEVVIKRLRCFICSNFCCTYPTGNPSLINSFLNLTLHTALMVLLLHCISVSSHTYTYSIFFFPIHKLENIRCNGIEIIKMYNNYIKILLSLATKLPVLVSTRSAILPTMCHTTILIKMIRM